MERTTRRYRRLALTFCLLPFALCLLPSPARAALLSRSSEISLGREAAQEYEHNESVDTDPVLASRVRRIGHRLIAAQGATEYPFEFHAVETNGINAFALPGGFIYLFRGLAQLVPGDDALAFILAHEISHVTQRHGVRQIEQSLALGAVLNFALKRSAASGILQLVIDMHYSRKDEAEADRLGLALMARAGFDPTQGAEAMAVIARAAKSEKFLPPLLRSHPATDGRIAALRQQAQTLRAAPHPPRTVAAPPPLPEPPGIEPPPSAVAPSDLFPLAVGMRWTYRVAGTPERQAFTTTVLEECPGRPGVFRVRTELDDEIASTRLLAVTAEGVCTLPDPPLAGPRAKRREGSQRAQTTVSSDLKGETPNPEPKAWHVEIQLHAVRPADTAGGVWETMKVPAGEFRAVRTLQRAASGEPSATVWLAPGVGVVRRQWEQGGVIEELEAFHRPPADEGAPDRAKKMR